MTIARIAINNKILEILPDEIPAVVPDTRNIFKTIQGNPEPPASMEKLQGRVEALNTLRTYVPDQKKERIKAILLVVLHITLIAMVALGFAVNPLLGLACLVTFCAIQYLCYKYAVSLNLKDGFPHAEGSKAADKVFIAGAPILAHHLFTRTNTVQERLTQTIQKTGEDFHESGAYFKQHYQALNLALDHKIAAPANEDLEQLRKAKAELEKGWQMSQKMTAAGILV